ncbi:hypothetical protein BRADI_3g61106v3 [Brachypodium distachyon]|uniref:Uncharacterized protein n=1 Tax=Brachypodium distachyon TaxID=15368 RepID=A0A0Q3FVN8_BRADI|nr:hypothetical protein BRADI_3g61106v3 [Brachypodium distachyon]
MTKDAPLEDWDTFSRCLARNFGPPINGDFTGDLAPPRQANAPYDYIYAFEFTNGLHATLREALRRKAPRTTDEAIQLARLLVVPPLRLSHDSTTGDGHNAMDDSAMTAGTPPGPIQPAPPILDDIDAPVPYELFNELRLASSADDDMMSVPHAQVFDRANLVATLEALVWPSLASTIELRAGASAWKPLEAVARLTVFFFDDNGHHPASFNGVPIGPREQWPPTHRPSIEKAVQQHSARTRCQEKGEEMSQPIKGPKEACGARKGSSPVAGRRRRHPIFVKINIRE